MHVKLRFRETHFVSFKYPHTTILQANVNNFFLQAELRNLILFLSTLIGIDQIYLFLFYVF